MENSTTKPIIIAGLCVIERDDVVFSTAERIAAVGHNLGVDIIFKASFDKANRTSIHSYRGVGIERGVELLGEVKRRYGMRITTDIHEAWQAERVASVADIIQIPAFLCRQTDLIVAAAHSGCIVNIKKAQFLSGRDMRHPYLKAIESGAREVWLTERGNMYGYNDLVVDLRNIFDMHAFAPTVIMDCTHSLQRPGAGDGCTAGRSEFIAPIALAAKAFGANGYFFEVHPTPNEAMCDKDNTLVLDRLEETLRPLL